MGPFEITKKMVADLPDESLRELLRHLLETEAKARGIAATGITARTLSRLGALPLAWSEQRKVPGFPTA